jgi:hypothetical protein
MPDAHNPITFQVVNRLEAEGAFSETVSKSGS